MKIISPMRAGYFSLAVFPESQFQLAVFNGVDSICIRSNRLSILFQGVAGCEIFMEINLHGDALGHSLVEGVPGNYNVAVAFFNGCVFDGEVRSCVCTYCAERGDPHV